MKKTDLLQPGSYGVYPQAVLRRDDLTASAKLVYIALLDCLRGEDETVYPQSAAICKMTACSRTAVLTALAALEAKRLIKCDRTNGTRSVYSFTPPDEWLPEITETGTENVPVDTESGTENVPVEQESGTENVPVEQESGTENVPVETLEKTDRYGKRTGPVRIPDGTGTDSELAYKEETETLNIGIDPPTPQGGCVGDFSLPDFPKTIEKIETAYREVFAVGVSGGLKLKKRLPCTWQRKARREFEKGDRAALAEIDADAIRGGMKLADARRKTFGLGWVLQFIAKQSAAAVEAESAKQNQTAAQLEAERNQETERQRQAAEAEAQKTRLEYFDTLPDSQRNRWRSLVCGEPFAPKRPEIIESMAAQLAWNDRPKNRQKTAVG